MDVMPDGIKNSNLVFPFTSWHISTLIPVFASGLVAYLYLVYLPSQREKRTEIKILGSLAKPIPRIKGKWPGNLDVLLQLVYSEANDYPTEIFSQWCETYGSTLDMGILWSHQILSADPEVGRTVLTTQFENFEKGGKWNKMCHNFLGNGIFAVDREAWQMRRATARPFFSQDRISDVDMLRRHVDILVQILGQSAEGNKPLDFQALMRSLTMDVTTDFLLGSSTDTLQRFIEGNREASQTKLQDDFSRAFDDISGILAKRVRAGASWYKYFEPFGDETLAPKKVIDVFVHPIIEKAVDIRKHALQTDPESLDTLRTSNFLQYLLDTTGEDAGLAKEEMINYLLAGRDTTSATLTFCIYALALYPHEARRVRDEAQDVLGTSDEISASAMKRLPYIRAFIDETLRLFPPVPFNIRRSIQETTLPSFNGPLYLPPRTSVTFVPFMFHRSKSIWGPDADEFKPERWLNGSTEEPRSRGGFIPFNAGRRTCLGQQFAYTVVTYVLLRLVLRFDFDLASDAQPPDTLPPPHWRDVPSRIGRKVVEKVWPQASFTLNIKGGFWIRARDVSTSSMT